MVVKNFETTGGGKLTPAYRDPYKVVRKLRNDRYVITDVRCHRDHIRERRK